MTPQQFDLLVKLIRGNAQSPASKAAYLVLVDGLKQAQAVKITGASASNVHDALNRYAQVHEQILKAYGLDKDSSYCNSSPRGVVYGIEERTPAFSTERKAVMKTELKVDWHPSGKRTLKERSEGARMWSDCLNPTGLLANSDPSDFYARVQQYIDQLLDKNVDVMFTDCVTKSARTLGIAIKTNRVVVTLHNLDFEKLAQHPEPLVVDFISQLLKSNYPNIYSQDVSWLAFREQIQIVHARNYYDKATQAEISLRWARLAKENRLNVTFDRTYGLSIEE